MQIFHLVNHSCRTEMTDQMRQVGTDKEPGPGNAFLHGGKTHDDHEAWRFSEKRLLLAEQRPSFSQWQFSLPPGRVAVQGGLAPFSCEHFEYYVNIITVKNVYRHSGESKLLNS